MLYTTAAPLIDAMKSETLVIQRLSLSRDQPREAPYDRPHILRENINNHQSIPYLNHISPKSIIDSEKTVRSKISESQSLEPKISTHCHNDGGRSAEYLPHSLLGNGLSISQDSLQVVNGSSTIQNPELLSSDYSDPKRVPGTNQNIYPYAPISPEFHERYPQLVDFFKQAVDAHKSLKYHTSKINYELRLCGSTPSNAVASIIIFCVEAIFKELRLLLNSKHIQRQYQTKKVSVLDKFQFTSGKPNIQASAPAVTPFKVIFWREALTPTLRKSAMERVIAKNHSILTMCGSLVRYGDRTSTLGLIISVNSKLYGLTVDHLFGNRRDEERPTITRDPDISTDEEDSEDSQSDCSWIDDVAYEELNYDEWVPDNEPMISEQSDKEVTMDQGLTRENSTSIDGHRVDPFVKISTPAPYLDWALIEFDSGYFRRPNAFYLEDDCKHPKFLQKISTGPKTSRADVFMISGVTGTRKGVMLNTHSYIGGKQGEELCQSWNVILSDSSRVIDGDCGSLIVDQETLEVYGYVVASNPLGEAYVVSLKDAFDQIEDALLAWNASLPSPQFLMKTFITHHYKAGQSDVADEARSILALLEGTSSINGRDESEALTNPLEPPKENLAVFGELEKPASYSILIRRLPLEISEETLRLMVCWSKEFTRVEVLAPDKSEDDGFQSAIMSFNSYAGAFDAKEILYSSTIGDVNLIIDEVLTRSPTSSQQAAGENNSNPGWSSYSTAQNGSPAVVSEPLDFDRSHLQRLFSPGPFIRNRLRGRKRITGKSLINNDFSKSEEAGEWWEDPAINYHGRQPMIPQIPISTPPGVPLTANSELPVNYKLWSQHYGRHNFPPVNPADQNPPCNTLYVGNLPIDASEDELKSLFSKQRGYKRLCFRTKQNGPMCFVEFEDVSSATKALHELYGVSLHNSVKSGIRLSFSKNPLGVRSDYDAGTGSLVGDPSRSFSIASGSPPGLSLPPEFKPETLHFSSGLNAKPGFTDHMTAGDGTSSHAEANINFPPAYMIGR